MKLLQDFDADPFDPAFARGLHNCVPAGPRDAVTDAHHAPMRAPLEGQVVAELLLRGPKADEVRHRGWVPIHEAQCIGSYRYVSTPPDTKSSL
jgi:hypothetical protein